MAAPAARRDEFAVLDQLIARSLVTLRRARVACGIVPTPRDVELRERAEDNLNALLDFRSDALRRPSSSARPPAAAGQLPA